MPSWPCFACQARQQTERAFSCILAASKCEETYRGNMSRRRKPGGGKSLDVVNRLQQRVEEGNYYEALQLYKTSYSRLKAQGRLDDAEELLAAGAIAMSQHNEVCGWVCTRVRACMRVHRELGAASHYHIYYYTSCTDIYVHTFTTAVVLVHTDFIVYICHPGKNNPHATLGRTTHNPGVVLRGPSHHRQ